MHLPITPPIQSMEAKVQSQLPRGNGWQYEPKWDGFRCLAFRDGDEVVLYSRNERPLTRYFPELVPALRAITPKRIVLDGEIVIFTQYGTDFDLMLQRIHPAASRVNMLATQTPASFVAFDVLADGEADFRGIPLRERRQRLERLLGDPPPPVYLSPLTHDVSTALSWLNEYRGTGLDGIVAKKMNDVYHPGVRAMIKVKEQRTADCVVGGFRWGKDGKRIGSLLLGAYRGKQLEYVGHTSSFDDQQRLDLVTFLAPYRGTSDFGVGRTPGGPSRWSTERSMDWEPLRPELVCEVGFDRLEGDRFRHAVRFLRWRPDKAPRHCTLEQLKAVARVDLRKLFHG